MVRIRGGLSRQLEYVCEGERVRVCMHLSLGALGAHLSCFIERGYLTVVELTDWNELAGLSLPSQSWDYQPCDRTPPPPKKKPWVLGIELWFSCLYNKLCPVSAGKNTSKGTL